MRTTDNSQAMTRRDRAQWCGKGAQSLHLKKNVCQKTLHVTKFRNYGAVILGHPLKTCSLAPSSGKFASVICRLEEGEDLGLRRQKMLILAGGEGAIFFSGVDG